MTERVQYSPLAEIRKEFKGIYSFCKQIGLLRSAIGAVSLDLLITGVGIYLENDSRPMLQYRGFAIAVLGAAALITNAATYKWGWGIKSEIESSPIVDKPFNNSLN